MLRYKVKNDYDNLKRKKSYFDCLCKILSNKFGYSSCVQTRGRDALVDLSMIICLTVFSSFSLFSLFFSSFFVSRS